MYLSVYLSRSGVCARRKAAELIKDGQVLVNGNPEINPAYVVQSHDKVVYMDRRVKLEEPVYVLLNKPRGVVSTCSDEQRRKNVTDLISIKVQNKNIRLYPVGRLDKETTGALVLTNDGELAQRMAHPKYEIKKTYVAMLDRPFEHADYERLIKGFFLYDGKFVPDRVYYPRKQNKYVVGVTVHSGKYRIIRRAFYRLGYEVVKLDRVGYGSISLHGLARGTWRLLDASEVKDFIGEK